MAFEATFSNVADSHLVCIQEGTGYKTQSINLDGQEQKGIYSGVLYCIIIIKWDLKWLSVVFTYYYAVA